MKSKKYKVIYFSDLIVVLIRLYISLYMYAFLMHLLIKIAKNIFINIWFVYNGLGINVIWLLLNAFHIIST